jgi:hypothetical protein
MALTDGPSEPFGKKRKGTRGTRFSSSTGPSEFPQESRHSSQQLQMCRQGAQVCGGFGAGSNVCPSEQQNLSYETTKIPQLLPNGCDAFLD